MSWNNVIPAQFLDRALLLPEEIKQRTTRWIQDLAKNEVFVFGDNEAHIHGAGAAKQAMKFGAKYGKQISEQTYGIPTKDAKIKKTLSLSKIQKYINDFVEYAKSNPDKIFLVTEIACGLAGKTPEEIAPLFKSATRHKNIHLPLKFWKVLYGNI